MKRLLVACEYSGRVRDAFRALGWDATSCDLLPSETPGPHHTGRVEDIIGDGWDMLIAFPPCTYLCSSGMHWTRRGLRDPKLTEEALDFVRLFLDAPIPKVAVENPIGVISSRIRKPDQIIHPHQFGEDASKATCLWLKGLPLLVPNHHFLPSYACQCGCRFHYDLGKYGCPNGCQTPARQVWGNQTASGQNKLAPSKDRWKIRSTTYQGIANAMATHWGTL